VLREPLGKFTVLREALFYTHSIRHPTSEYRYTFNGMGFSGVHYYVKT
jgi:hypothetical protein